MIAGICNALIPFFFESDLTQNQSIMIGSVVFVVGAAIVLTFDGTLIDYKKRQVKQYASLFGIKKGEWTPLPKQLAIEVLTKEEQSTNTANGISPTLSTLTITYEVILKDSSTQKVDTVLSFQKEKQAQEVAALLKNHLKV